jgi:hypothetical protein
MLCLIRRPLNNFISAPLHALYQAPVTLIVKDAIVFEWRRYNVESAISNVLLDDA